MEVQQKTAERMQQGIFTFNDMLAQFGQMKKMGSFQNMLKMVPGLGKMAKKVDNDQMDATVKQSEAIIQSMTPYERDHPDCLKASRKNRIAKGAGVKVMDVNKLIKQLEQMQMMTRMMAGGNMPNLSALQNMQRGGGLAGASKHAGSKKQKKKRKKKRK